MEAGELRLLRVGSFQGRLETDRQEYADALALVFGAEVHPFPAVPSDPPGFECRIATRAPAELTIPAALSPGGMLLGGSPACRTITTEALHAEVQRNGERPRIAVWVREGQVSRFALSVHFAVVLNKILFLLDRVILHAAAVRWQDAVHLFVGEKGSGKSTICLALARAGGTVLGEDRVVLRRTERGFFASGGDDRSRVTEQTERHFFPEPLAVAPRDFGGTPKKEIRLGDFFPSEPYRDFPVHRVFFPCITGRFRARRLKAQPALLRLMRHAGQFHRFAGAADQESFLDLLSGLAAAIPVYELELSTDLQDLDRLPDRLREV